MNATASILTVSSILFGFLFTGFWWALNRELTFDKEERHFKPGYVLLILSMGMLGYFGIITPLRGLAEADPNLLPSYRGILLVLIGTCGYMLTELGHYSVYQRPKYTEVPEWVFFLLTVFAVVGFAFAWWVI